MLRRFADRRAAAWGLAFLAAPAARRGSSLHAGRRFEVLNAGVAGYSSHQGVLRFLQEVDRYQPDLVLVSFGWNDAAEAIGQPDKTFKIPPWPVVVCQRALVRYRAYLVLMYYTQKWRAEPPVASRGRFHRG